MSSLVSAAGLSSAMALVGGTRWYLSLSELVWRWAREMWRILAIAKEGTLKSSRLSHFVSRIEARAAFWKLVGDLPPQ